MCPTCPFFTVEEEQPMFLSPARTKRRRRVGVLLSTALVAAGVSVMSTAGPAAAATGGAGAPVPYVHVEAENSATNGTALGPDYTYNTIEAEASGRRAVRLDATGEYVEFTVPSAANSMVVRLGIPDSATGSEYTAPLSLYINGTRQTDLTTTNKFSHLYGGYQFSNTPQGNHHWYFDEYQRLLPQLAAGTKVRIQKDANSSASSYTVDFMEFEQVADPLTQPAGSVSVTSQGADPTGVAESTNAFRAAIAAAGPGGTVWIPAGRFRVNGHTVVDNITVRGAGMWHSIVTGTDPGFYGKWRNEGGSSNVTLSNFQISGNVIERCDSCQVNGIGGALSNSTISNIWIEHTKVGMWMDGPMDHLVFDRMRVRDQTADGVNFHMGVTNSTVSNSSFRNTADDAMAMWSESVANANNAFDNNTVEQTVWANGIAVYGGTSNSVTDNVVIDSGISQGGGIHVANRFASTPLAGTTNVLRNTIIRSGGLDPNWQFGVGSLWFDARDGAMNSSVVVDDLVIRNSPLEAIHFVSGGSITNVKISNVTIDGVGTFVVQAQVGGSATFTNVQATRIGQAATPVYNCTSFGMLNGGGNGAWFTAPQYSQCGQWPTPVIWPDSSGLSIAPSAVDFGAQGTGSTSAARAVAISNNGSAAISLSGISTTGDFAQTNTCGSSLAGGASCTVNVTFSPTAAGNRSGTLTVANSASPATASLSGVGVAPGPILNANPGALAFGSATVGSTTAAKSVTVTNSGTSAATVSGVTVSGDYAQTNNCGSLAVGASCTVNVTFRPTTSGARSGTVTITSNANNSPTTVSLSGTGVGTDTNIAAGRTATASTQVNSTQAASTATDSDANTYWESNNNAFPQWLQVDLGAATSIGRVTLKLPPATAWATRTQTLSVQTSTDGSAFSTPVGSATYTFNPASGNTVSIPVPTTTARYVRINVTANSGWPAGQISELEVYPAGGTTTPIATLATNPDALSFAGQALDTTSAAKTVTVSNTGSAAASVTGVAASGDFSQTNNCGTSIAAGASCTVNVSFRPTVAGTRTGSLTITGNATNSPTTVALTGVGAGGTTSTNLAAGKATSESSHNDVYASSRVTDADQGSYWESANNAFPQWVQVDLGSAQSAGRVVLQLPPTWGARNQTLTLQGSTNGTSWSTLKDSASYTFAPAGNNSVTLSFTASTQRYFRVTITANTEWPAGQLSGFQVWNI
jgi:hypothetical protein